jgi:hypothetical protein
MRDILGGFGPESNQPMQASAGKGGVTSGRDVNRYAMPQGPKNIMDSKSPGLHGTNHGTENGCDSSSESGSAGIGGTNHGCCGSQGRY